jgi:hypothetical protein
LKETHPGMENLSSLIEAAAQVVRNVRDITAEANIPPDVLALEKALRKFACDTCRTPLPHGYELCCPYCGNPPEGKKYASRGDGTFYEVGQTQPDGIYRYDLTAEQTSGSVIVVSPEEAKAMREFYSPAPASIDAENSAS